MKIKPNQDNLNVWLDFKWHTSYFPLTIVAQITFYSGFDLFLTCKNIACSLHISAYIAYTCSGFFSKEWLPLHQRFWQSLTNNFIVNKCFATKRENSLVYTLAKPMGKSGDVIQITSIVPSFNEIFTKNCKMLNLLKLVNSWMPANVKNIQFNKT